MHTGALRYAAVLLLCLLGIASATAITLSRSDYRVDFKSLLDIWGDFVRDADRIGLSVTRISTEEETRIGKEILASYYGGNLDKNGALVAYINAVGNQLVTAGGLHRRDISYNFHVLDVDDANAWAVPGGQIFVTTGLISLMGNEAQLASILAHEIAHVDLRHAVERLQYQATLRRIVGNDLSAIAELGYSLISTAYSVQQEDEADRYGMLAMARAGYSPLESIEMFGAAQQAGLGSSTAEVKPKTPVTEVTKSIGGMLGGYFATHPTTDDRIIALMQLLSENAGAWQGKSFCVGQSNFIDQVSCTADRRPSEWSQLDLNDPKFHLRLAIAASGSGHLAVANSEYAKGSAAAPSYITELRTRAWSDAAHPEIARSELASAVLLEIAQLSLQNPPPNAAQLRIDLGRDAAEHAALTSMLGDTDYIFPPQETVSYAVPMATLCMAALSPDKTTWRPNLGIIADLVSEAKSRGYTPLTCRLGLGDLPDRPVLRARPDFKYLKGLL